MKKKHKKHKLKEKKKEKIREKLSVTPSGSNNEKSSLNEMQDDRKRPYNSMYDVKAPTEDEIEEWKRKRPREEDPMLQFIFK